MVKFPHLRTRGRRLLPWLLLCAAASGLFVAVAFLPVRLAFGVGLLAVFAGGLALFVDDSQ